MSGFSFFLLFKIISFIALIIDIVKSTALLL